MHLDWLALAWNCAIKRALFNLLTCTIPFFNYAHLHFLPALACKWALTRALFTYFLLLRASPLTTATTFSPQFEPPFWMKYSNPINSVKQPSVFLIGEISSKKWSSKVNWFWSFPIVRSEEKKSSKKLTHFYTWFLMFTQNIQKMIKDLYFIFDL